MDDRWEGERKGLGDGQINRGMDKRVVCANNAVYNLNRV